MQTIDNSGQAIKRRGAIGRRTASIDIVKEKITHFENFTFAQDFRYIEGYLAKEIENINMLRLTRRHLRYFRIIFSTGKLNVKTNKSQKEMRSFDLKDLLAVKPLKVRESKLPANGNGDKMLE